MAQAMTFGASVDGGSWPQWLRDDLAAGRTNGCVGTELVSEDERVRVWTIRLAPGQRIGFHTHVLDYFWTALNAGRARSHHEDGSTYESDYVAGETQHATYGSGERKTHDLENVGETELLFTTVEFLSGANRALPIPDSVRVPSARLAA